LLIDGGFQSEPAVKHKELLWALSRGIVVVGASSMGALRAAELSPFMIGVGLIYRWYRRCALAPDDAVAVLHGPAEANFAPLNEALIDIRMTIRAAFRQGAIGDELRRRLTRRAQAMNFRDRTLAHVLEESGAPHETVSRFSVRQKYLDAVKALELLETGKLPQPPRPPKFIMTRAFAEDVHDTGLSLGPA
jgi:hypothetical protein